MSVHNCTEFVRRFVHMSNVTHRLRTLVIRQEKVLNFSLTMHLSITLDNDQLDDRNKCILKICASSWSLSKAKGKVWMGGLFCKL